MADTPLQDLRPMGIGDILDTTLRLYRQRFVTFLAIVLVTYVPYAIVVALLIPQQAQNPGELNFVWIVPVLLMALIVAPLCEAAILHNISAGYLGEDLSASSSYRRALPRLLTLILARLLVGIVIMLGFVLFVVPGIIFSLWFVLVTPVVVLEGRGGGGAMGRSRQLMKGNLGKAFLLGLVLVVLGLIVQTAVGFASELIPWPHPALGVFVGTILQALILPIQIAPFVLLYYDMRIRKEAFDLEALAATLDPAEPT